MKVTEKGKLKPLYGERIKIIERWFGHKLGRWHETVSWDGCFKYTIKSNKKVKGVSDFLRRRATC